jgi:hypothetical protein
MLRLLPVFLLAALLGPAAVAAGFAINAPTIALFVFAGCLSLFVAALTAGALDLYEH